jgi:hypothetical protein
MSGCDLYCRLMHVFSVGHHKHGLSRCNALVQVTVEESLMFSAQLRLEHVSREDLRVFVEEVRTFRV